MLLQGLQTLLARLYDVQNGYAVTDFLLTDRRKLAALTECKPNSRASRASDDEQVLVRETPEGVDVAVYIDASVLQRLESKDPLRELNEENLADYCTAIEGVSHFHYLTWRASAGATVSLLELELQAEVDKYAAAVKLLTEQCAGRLPSALHERLFHRVRFCDRLDAGELTRYREANRYAARYCRKLEERFLRSTLRPEAWLKDIRNFYRSGFQQKLRLVAA